EGRQGDQGALLQAPRQLPAPFGSLNSARRGFLQDTFPASGAEVDQVAFYGMGRPWPRKPIAMIEPSAFPRSQPSVYDYREFFQAGLKLDHALLIEQRLMRFFYE